jgi:hypothetical protein
MFNAFVDAPFGKVGIRCNGAAVRRILVAAGGIGGFAHHAGDGFFRQVKRGLLAHEGVSIA